MTAGPVRTILVGRLGPHRWGQTFRWRREIAPHAVDLALLLASGLTVEQIAELQGPAARVVQRRGRAQ